ncbi:hypothetical protein BJ170DRAFT_626138 [Xylariales sp. AK1849]|nr:hypothetical protein BJ170DRAFT_626138 [Xylariales sp. AK1849]
MLDDEGSNNPFVRYKNYVNHYVSQTWHGILSLAPSDPETSRGNVLHNEAVSVREIMLAESQQRESTMASRSVRMPIEGDTERLRRLSISSWVNFSSYSPVNLQHLPQPVPRDAPRFTTAQFTYADAFEDLMSVSSGRSMPSIHQRIAWQAKRTSQTGVFNNGSSATDWIALLEHDELWDAYFPRPTLFSRATGIYQKTSWELPANSSVSSGDLERRTGLLLEEVSMCEEERKLRRLYSQFTRSQPPPSPIESPAMHLKLDGCHNPRTKQLSSTAQRDAPVTEHSRAEPDTSEDVYLAAESSFALDWPGTQPWLSSWDKLLRLRTSEAPPGYNASIDTDDMSKMQTLVSPDGCKVLKVQRQSHGVMTQTTKTYLRYDANGNLVQQTVTTFQNSPTEADDQPVSRRTLEACESTDGSSLALQKGEDSLHNATIAEHTYQTGWFWARRA